MTDATAPCRKCESDIPTDATRCPACGYDATPGLLATLGWILALPFAGLEVLLIVTAQAGALTTALTIGEAIGAAIASGILFGVPIAYVVWFWNRRSRTAAEGSK